MARAFLLPWFGSSGMLAVGIGVIRRAGRHHAAKIVWAKAPFRMPGSTSALPAAYARGPPST